MNKLVLFLLAVLPSLAMAQEVDPMMENGKINVVYIVVLIIVLGMFGYLIYLSQKVSKVEKKFEELEK